MARSIHITKKNFKGLTKMEIDEQAFDPASDLAEWNKKSLVKKKVKKNRRNKESET